MSLWYISGHIISDLYLFHLLFIKNNMNFLIRLLVTAVAAYILSKLLTGVHIANFTTAIIFALVLAVLNAIVKPLLIILTLPITIVTLGIFLFVINALIILLAD